MLLGLLVGPLVKYVKQLASIPPPGEALAQKWNRLTKDADVVKGGWWLGHFERLLFFGAVWPESYEIIAGWLAFKVASKWEVWSSIISVPEKLTGVDDGERTTLAIRKANGKRLMYKEPVKKAQ